MSKDFDTTLSDAIDLAAAAARTAGAPAARIRGRKRTVRKRIAVSAASIVLVAAGATTAFSLVPSHDGSPQVTASSPRATAPTSASPTAPATASPTTSPSASTSASPSSGATPPATSSPPASGQGTTADPQQAVAAAWLSPSQLPFAETFDWKALHAEAQGSSPIGQPLTATVFYVANTTPFQALTMCGDPAKLLVRTTGAQHTEFATSSASSGNVASQFVFFFADAASAQQTFAWLQSQYGSSCLPGTGVSITKTAGDGQTSATWLTRKGSSGPVNVAPYTREYFVLRGSTIAYVSVISTSNLPTAYDDAAQLSTIAAHLCVYGGPCE